MGEAAAVCPVCAKTIPAQQAENHYTQAHLVNNQLPQQS